MRGEHRGKAVAVAVQRTALCSDVLGLKKARVSH